MKFIIFAGGIGTRLWPLSRENSPKQFDKIFEGRSTIQLAVERITGFGLENIFIQTVEAFKDKINEQIPGLTGDQIFIEPERRNVGPAVCYAMRELEKRGHTGPVAILWADHLMERKNEFIDALKIANKLIVQQPERFIFMAERPRFANNNLGWINVGDKKGEIDGKDYFAFRGWKYKPSSAECDRMFKSGNFFWNPGYFVTSVKFLLDQYRSFAPGIYRAIFSGRYSEAEAVHFDRAIIEKVDLENAVVIKTNMGWSDPGTLYALKEALEETRNSNVETGTVASLDCLDCLLFNLENEKVMAAVGVNGLVIVNTSDALIVVHKDEVQKVTDLVKKMKEAEKFKKFL